MHAHTAHLSLLALASVACAQITVDLRQQVVNASTVYVAPADQSDLSKRADAVTTVATNRFNSYTAVVSVGEPNSTYHLLIDTGSANTWIRNLTLTASSIDLHRNASVNYGIGSFAGDQYLDTLSVAGAAVHNQSLSRATSQVGYDDVDGVLAFGPTALTQFTVANTTMVPTVMDNLVKQGVIPANVVGIAFVPATSVTDEEALNNGRLTLGGVDNSSFVGEIRYMNVTETYPSSMYWGLDCSDMVFQDSHGRPTHLASEPALRTGIIDSGTTLIQIPSDAFRRYVAQLPGASVNDDGFLAIPDTTVPMMGNFTFVFSGHHFTLSPSAQLFPPEVAAEFGQQQSGYSYSVFGSSGTRTTGLDFTLGMMFLERFYSVYDVDNTRIGFAETTYTLQHTSERASYRKAKRAHNARVQHLLHLSSMPRITPAADNETAPVAATKNGKGNGPTRQKVGSIARLGKPAGSAGKGTTSAAEGKKRRLGALKALDPFEAAVSPDEVGARA